MNRIVLSVYTYTREKWGGGGAVGSGGGGFMGGVTKGYKHETDNTEGKERKAPRQEEEMEKRKKKKEKSFHFISFRAKLALRNSICFDILCMKYGYSVPYASVVGFPFHVQ